VQVDGVDTQLVTIGSLISVAPSQLTFSGTIASPTGTVLGVADYVANAHTIFHIDGVPSVGATGLALLGAGAFSFFGIIYVLSH
jgi:hypothetical protein